MPLCRSERCMPAGAVFSFGGEAMLGFDSEAHLEGGCSLLGSATSTALQKSSTRNL